jgi:hypothetical protein
VCRCVCVCLFFSSVSSFCRYFQKAEVQPFFALSWILTWFSHGFDNLDDIARLFDLFIPSHPLMPLYVGAAVS